MVWCKMDRKQATEKAMDIIVKLDLDAKKEFLAFLEKLAERPSNKGPHPPQ